MLTTEVADRVHRLEHAYVNCYLVEDDDGVLVVDTGLPRTWALLGHALRAIGRRPRDVRGVVLTHAHFDHTGCAERLRTRLGVAVHVHDADARLAAHPYRYAHENPRAAYPIRHPAAIPILGAMAAAGALAVPGVDRTAPLVDGAVLDLPGRPRVLHVPGHTDGSCALHLADRDVLLTGDALVTLDPYTAGRGPQVVAGAATADSALALASLDVLLATGAGTLLPGHGDPWTGGVTAAVTRARAVGAH